MNNETPSPPFAPLTGRCRCQNVSFRMEAAPNITHSCHCRLCQQFSGSPFRVNAMIETGHLTLIEGNTRPYHGLRSQKQLQCSDCGCTLWTHHPDLGDAIAFVGVGLLDEGERLPPEAHYFTRSRHPWIKLPEGVPAFEQLGDPGKAGARERIMAALSGGRGSPEGFMPGRSPRAS
jgi:hypothetical protein